MVQGAITDWLSYFETIAAELGVDATVVENNQFQIQVNTDKPASGKVRYSEFPNRKEDHIWQRYDAELERLNDSDERVFVIQLDVENRSEYKWNCDHFIFIPHDLLKQESKKDGRIYIHTDEPGHYETPFSGYVDNWNALFEYLTEETYDRKLSDIIQEEDIESITNPAPYYWVNQGKTEIEEEYLRAPTDERFQYDLPKLKVGDIVFSYHDGEVVGYHEVIQPARIVKIPSEEATEYSGNEEVIERYRVETNFNYFEVPLAFADIFSKLWEYRLDQYYPVNPGGINQQYLFNLSEAAGEYLLEKGTRSKSSTDHEILTHYIDTPSATVWMYSSSPSDWLTILRRGALQFWDDIKSSWEQIESGDIVLFHVKRSDGGDKALPNYDLPESGFLGCAVVDDKRTKTEHWWWNEYDSLSYPYIVILSQCYITCDIRELDRNRALFELSQTEIESEVQTLSEGLIPWAKVSQISQEMTDKDLPGPGSIANLSANRSGIESFLQEYLTAGADMFQHIEFNESVQLPAMLPISDEPTHTDSIERQLENTKQVVFYGPPGTGKTYTAQRFARWWLNKQDGHTPSETQLETVTFHPSFSYEDFIEGLTAEEKDGEIAYEIKDGVFKKISQRAKQAYEHARDSDEVDEPPRYVLIIDEINRGNLAQIFGETMTLLESDKRHDQENEVKISLAHSGDSFVVPPNLYVIGTMNTADRSIALVDAALRRRFRFISFPPKYKVIINDYDAFDSLDEVRTVAETDPDPYRSLIALSILALRGLNERIVDAPDLGKGKQIGHSYLMNLDDVDDVLDAWKYEILPLIEEYYFGQFDRIREELFDGSGDRLFHWEQEEIADFTADELRRTLAGLEEISLAEPETEASEDTQHTIELLLNEGVLEAGTQLVFDESKVPDDADRPYDSAERFWRCEITGKTGQSDNIQWLHNDEEYSFSGLAQTILEQISDHSDPVTGPDYWRHPEFDDRLLADLRTDAQSGELIMDEQTTD